MCPGVPTLDYPALASISVWQVSNIHYQCASALMIGDWHSLERRVAHSNKPNCLSEEYNGRKLLRMRVHPNTLSVDDDTLDSGSIGTSLVGICCIVLQLSREKYSVDLMLEAQEAVGRSTSALS